MANNVSLSYPSSFYHQFFDENGKPLSSGKLYTYIAGSSTPVVTYKTISGGTESANRNTNPIILDMAGMAELVISTDTAYKFVLFDKNDVKKAEWDNVTAGGSEGGSGSEDIVVEGTQNEIDVSASVTQGVKHYVVSLSNSIKSAILFLTGLYNSVVNSLENKADKVQGATSGNLASLDANGNLTDSGSKVSDFKTKQTAVTDPSASGTGLEFIDSVSQNTNGDITPHKKSVQDGTTAQKGVVKLNNAIDSSSTTEAATPKAVKDAYDALNNKIIARATFLSQAEWDVQSQLQGDPAKVYYVENGTGEDAYTVYVWNTATNTYVEVDESSISLDGYWHDAPTTTGDGNVVTSVTLGNNGVPQIVKGITALTQHQDISGKLDKNGDASNTTSTFTIASSRTNISSGEKLSTIFGKIAKWFADLKALAFKDNVSDSDISGTIADAHIASASTWNGKQNALPTSGTASSTYAINVSGSANTANYLIRAYVNKSSQTTKIWKKIATSQTFTNYNAGSICLLYNHSGYLDEFGLDSIVSVSIHSGSAGSLVAARIDTYSYRSASETQLLRIGSTNQYEVWVRVPTIDTNMNATVLNSYGDWTINTDASQTGQLTDDEFTAYKSNNPSIGTGYNYNIVKAGNSGVGSSTVPVYVDQYGRVNECDPMAKKASSGNGNLAVIDANGNYASSGIGAYAQSQLNSSITNSVVPWLTDNSYIVTHSFWIQTNASIVGRTIEFVNSYTGENLLRISVSYDYVNGEISFILPWSNASWNGWIIENPDPQSTAEVGGAIITANGTKHTSNSSSDAVTPFFTHTEETIHSNNVSQTTIGTFNVGKSTMYDTSSYYDFVITLFNGLSSKRVTLKISMAIDRYVGGSGTTANIIGMATIDASGLNT